MYFIVLVAKDESQTVVQFGNGVRALFKNLELAKLAGEQLMKRDDFGKEITGFLIVDAEGSTD